MSARYFKETLPDFGFSNAGTLFSTFRDNSNSSSSTLTFSGAPVTTDDYVIQGLHGGGNWNISSLIVDGSVTSVDCVNTTITGGSVYSWVQKSGSMEYSGITTGAAQAHYRILGGSALIDSSATIDHSAPVNYSIGASGLVGSDKTFVTVIPGVTKIGQPIIADLVAGPNGEIYYAGDSIADGITFDPSGTGIIRDLANGILSGAPALAGSVLVKSRTFVSTTDDVSSGITPVESSIVINYDPVSALNRLVITASFFSETTIISGENDDARSGRYILRRTTGVQSDLISGAIGNVMSRSSGEPDPSSNYQSLVATEAAGDTSTHRYVVVFYSIDTDLETDTKILGGSGGQAVITVREYNESVEPPENNRWVNDEEEQMVDDLGNDFVLIG